MDFDEYLVAGRAGGWSPATQAQYGWHLARFGAWLAEQGCYQPDGLTRALLRGYGAALADVYSPATRQVSAIAIRSWLRWMAEEGCCRVVRPGDGDQGAEGAAPGAADGDAG
ncbi:MAG: site-specific integrase [Rhodospirillales bacterium]|nr:site-specific integrase [Rhodospirillales bacterium]